jgi:hypothetical protein
MMGCVYFIVEPIILDIFPNCGGYHLLLLRAFHATDQEYILLRREVEEMSTGFIFFSLIFISFMGSSLMS